MVEIDATNAADFLRATGRLPAHASPAVRELAGGVSNIVLRVDLGPGERFVLKQCRERLRVAMDWRAPLERIWTEVAAMRLLFDVLPPGTVPRILFEDRDHYLYAMECAPDDAVTWKQQLMACNFDVQRAVRVGELLARVHVEAAGHPALAGRLADTSLFEHLRVDPYYRTVAQAHPDLAPALEALIAAMPAAPDRTLVHGDFSPKNLLVSGNRLILLDFECAHAGDPAFDIGFLASHLVLKTFRAARLEGPRQVGHHLSLLDLFWASYVAWCNIDHHGDRSRRGVRHAAACLLARLDGKSPVEYRHELDQHAVRRLAREILQGPPGALDFPAFIDRIAPALS